MTPSEVSVPGSMRTRLALYEPECNGIVPEELLRGAIGVTMMVVIEGKPQLQPTSAKQQQQRAAEVKEIRRLPAVAKKELKETPWVSPEDLAKLPLAEQTKRADGGLEGEEGGGRGGGEPRVGDLSRCGRVAG